MKIQTWNAGMGDNQTADLAYWERNMLALFYAEGWYNDDVDDDCPEEHELEPDTNACPTCERDPPMRPRFAGWRRVLTLENGQMTFHVPDDFDVGDLRQIEPNWNGHTTEQKWRFVADSRDIPCE